MGQDKIILGPATEPPAASGKLDVDRVKDAFNRVLRERTALRSAYRAGERKILESLLQEFERIREVASSAIHQHRTCGVNRAAGLYLKATVMLRGLAEDVSAALAGLPAPTRRDPDEVVAEIMVEIAQSERADDAPHPGGEPRGLA